MSVGAVLVRIRSCCCCRILHPSLQNTNSTISFSLPPLPKHRFSRSSQVMSSSSFSSFAGRGGRGADMKSDRERSRGRGGRGGGAGGSGMDKIDALGRLLTRILRHMASELSLNMRNDGYVKVKDLLQLNMKTFANVPLRSHTVDDVKEVAQNESTVCAWLLNNCNGVKLQAVSKDNKQRFGLLEEDGELLIRANQGHTLKVVESESLLRPILSADEVPVCVHGTYRKNLDSILQSGLKRMERLHVHFSCGLPTDGEVISGMRKNINVIIFLDVKKALEDGMKLYISENKVILTEGFDGVVPVKYFEKIEAWPSRKCIPLQT
ncbi:tRNA 2'-phosphotransferase 1 [Linum perenne]